MVNERLNYTFSERLDFSTKMGCLYLKIIADNF